MEEMKCHNSGYQSSYTHSGSASPSHPKKKRSRGEPVLDEKQGDKNKQLKKSKHGKKNKSV